MILRYLILFGGVVLMITGCNGLVSQQFGTHRLRTVPLTEAMVEGLGDADFVELTGAVLGEAQIVGPALRASDTDYLLRPILTPEQAGRWAAGETVETRFVGWRETDNAGSTSAPACPPPDFCALRGLVSTPTDRKNPVNDWPAQRIKLATDITYLQLGEAPMAWYWNLALFFGGLALALVPEALRFSRERRGGSADRS